MISLTLFLKPHRAILYWSNISQFRP